MNINNLIQDDEAYLNDIGTFLCEDVNLMTLTEVRRWLHSLTILRGKVSWTPEHFEKLDAAIAAARHRINFIYEQRGTFGV